jgi:hypothetical protein
MELRYLDYEATRTVPNIVVDGSANDATVLTLSHWPGARAPDGLARDLSAEMAFAYLDNPCPHPTAAAVTNNHFDQDGLVSVYALTQPDVAQANRELLIDVAAAGDFATYRDRRAARASIVIAHWSDIGWGYSEALPHLVALAIDPDPYRDIWAIEDANLSASERAIAGGAVTISEIDALDLAVVEIDEVEPSRSGHRFAHETFEGLHPMALHNATDRFRILVIHQQRFVYVDRYETWVQYQSRPTLPRRDMRSLAESLSRLDHAEWTAGSPDELSPIMTHQGESALDRDTVVEAVETFLDPPSNP